jgi:uncharacterized protein YcbK (DUF882 family)
MRRRCGVGLVLVAVLAAGVPPAGADPRGIWVKNLHTNEEAHLRPFGELGVPTPLGWARADHLFRSWRTDRARPINPRLLRVLGALQRRLGGRRIELVSGFRVPDRNDRLSSYHQVGRAVDAFFVGIPNRQVFDLCASGEFGPLGCGLYPSAQGSSHIHIDVRSRPCVWVDLSRYGEPAVYVPRARQWIQEHPLAGAGRGQGRKGK